MSYGWVEKLGNKELTDLVNEFEKTIVDRSDISLKIINLNKKNDENLSKYLDLSISLDMLDSKKTELFYSIINKALSIVDFGLLVDYRHVLSLEENVVGVPSLSNIEVVSAVWILRNYDSDHHLYRLAKKKRSEELNSFAKPFNWYSSKEESCDGYGIGKSVFSKKTTWLFSNAFGLEKLNVIIEENDGFINKRFISEDYTKSTNGVLFAVNNDVSYHNFPKNWVIGVNGISYPISYAKQKNIEIIGLMDNSILSESIGRINDIQNLKYSHSCGYYNADTCLIKNFHVCKKENLVRLCNDGGSVHISNAVYFESRGGYVHINSCVLVNGDYHHTSDVVNIRGENYLRSDPRVSVCSSCGSAEIGAQFTLIGDASVCRNCVDSFSRHLIKKCYSTNVIDHKGFGSSSMKISGENVYLGLELECFADYNSSSRKEVVLGLNTYDVSKENTYCVATQDGSLDGEHGVEYIFRPEGLLQQQRNVKHFIENAGQFLAEDAGDGYGLHVHVSSHFLSDVDKLKIQNFISIFEKYFRSIGARNKTEYQYKKDVSSNRDMRRGCSNRYSMVNTGNPATIEYRFPKSLVDEVHINTNLEMSLAVTMFCKYHLSSVSMDFKKKDSSSLEKFIEYVAKNKKQYPLLHAFNSVEKNVVDKKLEKYRSTC